MQRIPALRRSVTGRAPLSGAIRGVSTRGVGRFERQSKSCQENAIERGDDSQASGSRGGPRLGKLDRRGLQDAWYYRAHLLPLAA